MLNVWCIFFLACMILYTAERGMQWSQPQRMKCMLRFHFECLVIWVTLFSFFFHVSFTLDWPYSSGKLFLCFEIYPFFFSLSLFPSFCQCMSAFVRLKCSEQVWYYWMLPLQMNRCSARGKWGKRNRTTCEISLVPAMGRMPRIRTLTIFRMHSISHNI